MYGKIFGQIFDGTLATKGPWQALVTFEQLIILADKHGFVDMTPEAISRRTTLPLEIILIGLEALEQPDPDSRSPDEEGRRIVRLSDTRAWGWRLVNHGHYRKIRSEEERREYHKLYQRERRAKKAVNCDVNTSTANQQNQPIAVSSKQDAVGSKQESLTPLVDFVLAHEKQLLPGRKGSSKSDRTLIEQRLRDGFAVADLTAALDGNAVDGWHRANQRVGIRYALADVDRFKGLKARQSAEVEAQTYMTVVSKAGLSGASDRNSRIDQAVTDGLIPDAPKFKAVMARHWDRLRGLKEHDITKFVADLATDIAAHDSKAAAS